MSVQLPRQRDSGDVSAADEAVAFANGVLNAVSTHIAVIDGSGEIVAVNAAWRQYARQNGDPPEALCGIGVNYLSVCQRAAERGDSSARAIRLGIESVMQGLQDQYTCEYSCHSPREQRWFSMMVSRMPQTTNVVISHENITARKRAGDELKASHDELERRVAERTAELERRNHQLNEEIAERERMAQRLRRAAKAFDSAAEAIFVTDAEHRIVAVNPSFSRITGYAPEEVIGLNPRLLGSGRHDPLFFAALWQTLKATGQWQGEIWNRRKNGEVFPAWESIGATFDADGQVIDHVSVFSDISSFKRAEERLAYLAHHDPLTGLANRLLFAARMDQALEHARRHGGVVGLLFIDMDRFKFVNDSLGHSVGDQYLRAIADRLRTAVRSEDTVARLGGDEFAVLAADLTHAQDAGRLADKLLAVLIREVGIAGRDVACSASIGISIYPDDALHGEELLKAADTAMYQAKGEGRNGARFYRPEMSAQASRRLALESSLRHALSRGELLLHYQPLVDLASQRCVGLEALLRWQSPEHGLVGPEVFIPLAEETRLIQPIGQWVVERALEDLAGWRAQGMPPVRLAVNVSWRQFNDEGFVAQMGATIEAHGLRAQDLELDLEITESALQHSKRAVDDLRELHNRGVRVMIDDFGTGYSSLSQLMNLPVDGLKIDRSFLRDAAHDPHSRAIIRAVIALAKGLDLDIVGEGVETQAQRDFLRAEGCALAQGFLFGRPVPAAQVPALVASIEAVGGPGAPAVTD